MARKYYAFMRSRLALIVAICFGMVVLVAAIEYFFSGTFKSPKIEISSGLVSCRKTSCLLDSLRAGKIATQVFTQTMDEYGFIETSRATVGKVGNVYKLTFRVLNIKPTGAPVAALRKKNPCPALAASAETLVNGTVTCTLLTPGETYSLVTTGLSEENIEKYHCKGDLIDQVEFLCGKKGSANYHFPFGLK